MKNTVVSLGTAVFLSDYRGFLRVYVGSLPAIKVNAAIKPHVVLCLCRVRILRACHGCLFWRRLVLFRSCVFSRPLPATLTSMIALVAVMSLAGGCSTRAMKQAQCADVTQDEGVMPKTRLCSAASFAAIETIPAQKSIKAEALPVIVANLPVEQGGISSLARKGPLVDMPDSVVAEAAGVPSLGAPVPMPRPGSQADIAMKAELMQLQARAPVAALTVAKSDLTVVKSETPSSAEAISTSDTVLSQADMAAVASGGSLAVSSLPVPLAHPHRPDRLVAAVDLPSSVKNKKTAVSDADLLTGSVAGSAGKSRLAAMSFDFSPSEPPIKGPVMVIGEVVGKAISDHPEIGIVRSRIDEAQAGMKVARSTYFPQVQSRFTAGQGTPIENSDAGIVKVSSSISSTRSGNLALKQQLLDFGATKHEILKNKELSEAQKYALLDKIEEISLKTVNSYLKILEQRESLALANANVDAHQKFARLVKASQEGGNGTAADVSRIEAKLVDVQTVRTQLDSDLQVARDQFIRLVRMEPGRLKRPVMPSTDIVPDSATAAIAQLPVSSHNLLALEAKRKSVKAELAVQRSAYMPRASFEVEGNLQEYLEPVNKSNWDMRAQVVLTHKLFDGGARRGQMDQIHSKMNQTELAYMNTKDELEANVRQSFRSLEAARRKLATIREGVVSSRKVKELYIEQFRAGKRTVFELLDSQTSLYNAEKELISNQFDELRATYGLLRTLGKLGETLLVAKS